jgi:hypothetical protein
MRVFAKLPLIIALTLLGGSITANAAANVTQRRTVAAYRVELHITAPVPLFSKQEVADKHIKKGMEIVGGAAPIVPDAASHPNRHLAVSILRRRSGQVVTDATPTISFVPTGAKGRANGAPIDVPVVVMQEIGKGPASTRYGNNVTMPAGHYNVTVMVKGRRLVFVVALTDAPPGHIKR